MSQRVVVPPRTSHQHDECLKAIEDDYCKSNGWCFGQTCELIVPSFSRPKAKGRCLTCRRRKRDRSVVVGADPTVRHLEGPRP